MSVIVGRCAGRCGAEVRYVVDEYTTQQPLVRVISGCVAYKGGHLCVDCERVVEDALNERGMEIARTKRAAKETP